MKMLLPSDRAACQVSPRMGLKGFFQRSKPWCSPATNQEMVSLSRSRGSPQRAARLRKSG
jgi:hypothetical protein